MTIAVLVNLVIYLVIVGVILGLLYYLVGAAPIPEPFKGWLQFLVLAIAVIVVIYLLLGLLGGAGVPHVKLGLLAVLPFMA